MSRRNNRRPSKATPSLAGKPVRAKFDAAQTTDSNAKHWAMADVLSARGSHGQGVRNTLRKRARYETDNNCWASGITRTVAFHTVGSGPRLQILSDNEETNSRIEKAFAKWARQIGFAEKTLIAKETQFRDGEIFGRLMKDDTQSPVALNVRLYESDQCTSPFGTFQDPNYDDGLHINQQSGKPDKYFFLDYHPGDPQYVPVLAGEWYQAKDVLHYFRSKRPGQLRGIPELTPALPLFAILRRYTLATLSSAEFISSVTGFLKTQASPEVEVAESAQSFYSFAYERGMLTSLPEGWTVEQLTNIPLTTNYEMFLNAVLNEIARCVNVPFNVAACNSKGLNYSSGRMDHLVWDRDIEVDLVQIEAKWCDPIFAAWLDEAQYLPLFDGLVREEIQHQWCWDARPIIDEESDAKASAERLKTGQSVLPMEYQRRGYGNTNDQLRLGAQALGMTLQQYQARIADSLFGPAPIAAEPVLPIEGEAGVPATSAVQDTALNEAQIASLLLIVEQVTGGNLPTSAASSIISSSFPFLTPEQVAGIVDPLEKFAPATLPDGSANPVAAGGTPSQTAGAFTGTKRRDFTNNQKQTQDVLTAFIGGASEVLTRASLSRLGWSDAAVSELIADAADGVVDQEIPEVAIA